jgi:hypothetical protein
MDRLDTIAQEIVGVECENPANAVDIHHRHQLGIMDFDFSTSVRVSATESPSPLSHLGH